LGKDSSDESELACVERRRFLDKKTGVCELQRFWNSATSHYAEAPCTQIAV
jgi:hypothetical protein